MVPATLDETTMWPRALELIGRIVGAIDQAQIGRVQVGQRVDIRVDAYADKVFAGVVDRVPEDRVVPLEGRRHRNRPLLPQARAAGDVGEQERERARGDLGPRPIGHVVHAPTIREAPREHDPGIGRPAGTQREVGDA
jgi:hypothetical protein